ncbi:ZWILC protein, partial [Phainopepla nitens]|nr:ZWILC protein [Phainopepla nitens]
GMLRGKVVYINVFISFRIREEGKDSIPEHAYLYETDVEISLVGGSCKSPVEQFWSGSSAACILQKATHNKESDSMEESRADDAVYASEVLPKERPAAQALPVGRAKQLISLYTMMQNPNMSYLGRSDLVVLPPLWARCDGSDPQHTYWLGAEPLRAGSKVTGLNIYTVSCRGPTADKTCFANLEELKMEHKIRHHSSVVTTKGFARYELIAAAAIEDTITESGSNICVDITWNGVEKILEPPPLVSAATLSIALELGDPRSPVFQLYQELQFLLALAEGLKMGVTKWPEPSESESALKLVQEFLTDLKKKLDGDDVFGNKNETEKIKCDTAAVDSCIKSIFGERGELDFTEQLWCKMKSVSSYQELIDCFTLVIKSLERGEIQPWIHQGSSSFLSQLIQQSYHGKMEDVSLRDITPIQMLLEIGLEKMKKDYVNFFIGEPGTCSLLFQDYFISTSEDLQEQVHRVQKLHHVLEIMVSCTGLLQFRHENLFPLTQICMKYYKENPLNEKHVFQLPIRPGLVKKFYQNDNPEVWKVEISSGHGQKEVKTTWQVSTSAPVELGTSDNSGFFSDSTVNGSSEERLYFITTTQCSQVQFT